MLQSITWNEYLGGVVILLIVYYLIIGTKYFKEDIRSLLAGKLKNDPGTAKNKVSETGKESFSDPASFDELEAVVNDLRYAVLEKAGRSIGREELLNRLKERLAEYTGLQKPAYRAAINNFIITHAQELCDVTFSEHELNSAWQKISK